MTTPSEECLTKVKANLHKAFIFQYASTSLHVSKTATGDRMAFQVLIKSDDRKETPLTVATSNEDFNKTTIKQMKEKFKLEKPGSPGKLKIY